MIVFQVDPKRILAFPFEGDAPRAIYMDAVALWLALQGMEIKKVFLYTCKALIKVGQL